MLRRLVTFTLALIFASGGCLAALDEGGLTPQVAPEDADPASTDEPRNAFLLDGVRPFSAAVSGGAEPSILVDAAGGFIWVGDTSGVYRSSDGGATWMRSADPLLPGVFGDGWALAQDDVGRLYASTTQGQFIGLAVSEDGGATWAHSNQVVFAGTIADRPWVAARGDGEVVVIQNGDTGEMCAASSDAGRTFLQYNINGGSPNAGNAVLDSQGHLYYANDDTLYRFAKPCVGGALGIPLPPHGAQIFTQVAVDDSDRVYAAQPTPGNGAMQIHGRESGRTFKSLVISPPQLKSNTFATLSAHGDEIAVAWYASETAGNPSDPGFNGAWNVYVARVTDFWTASPTITWTRLTTEPNHIGNFCMSGIGCSTGSGGDRDLLDYMMLDHDQNGGVHVAYGHDGAGSRSEVRYAYVP